MSKRKILGPKLKSFTVDPKRQSILAGIIGLGFLIALMGTVGFLNTSIATSFFPISQEERRWLALLIVGLFIVVVFWWARKTNKQKQIEVHRDGIAWRNGRKVHLQTWDKVEIIQTHLVHRYFWGKRLWTTQYYQVQFTDGRTLSFGSAYQGVEDLANMVKNKTLPILYRRLADKFNDGETVNFGNIAISREKGIKIGRKTIPWDVISRVSIKDGVMSIEKKGVRRRITVKLSRMPNADLFVTILKQVIKEA